MALLLHQQEMLLNSNSYQETPELFDEKDHEENYDSHYPDYQEIKVYS